MKKILLVTFLIFLSGCSPLGDSELQRADKLSLAALRSYEAAARIYERVLAKDPSSKIADSVRLKLGSLYYRHGQFARAIDVLKSLDNRSAKLLSARSLIKNADFPGALEIFNKLGDKGDAEYLYDYGFVLEKSNLYDKALSVYEKIVSDPQWGQRASLRIKAINLAAGAFAFSGVEEEVRDIIQASPSQDAYPEASAVFLLVDEAMTLTQDNRFIEESHCVIKILNDRGREKFGEISLSYDSTYEKLELEYARTITPDGHVVTVGDKNIRDVSLYLNFPLYSNARARIISMPDVTVGCVIEYKVKLTRSQLPNKKDFNTAYWLQADEPILWERCVLSVPQTAALKYKIVNAAYNTFGFTMSPRVKEEGGRRVYSLEFKNVPQIIPEPGMPPLSRANPYILFSTFESWQDIYFWWRALFQDKIVVDDSMKKKVLELTKDKKTQEEKIRSIYNFCAEDIRYVAVEYGDAGYEPHFATEIFKNKYGDCKDKAILLVAMLKEAGIEAYPVLISTEDSFDVSEDVPNILFNHAIAALRLDGELVFMDTTPSTASFFDLPLGDQGRSTLVFFKDHYEWVKTPLFGPAHNRMMTEMMMKVKADESIHVARTVEAAGVYQQAQRYWLKFTMPALIEETLKNKARQIADSAILIDYKIKNVDDLDQPVSLSYSFSAPQYLRKAGRQRFVEEWGRVDTALVSKDSRKYPIEHSGLDSQVELIEIELPAHLAVKYVPDPISVENPWFSFKTRYETKGKHALRYHWESRTKQKVITVAEYAAYKKAVEDLAFLLNQQLVFEEN